VWAKKNAPLAGVAGGAIDGLKARPRGQTE
jgi:hypothetical protein